MPTVIYEIRCKASGRIYVGSSSRGSARWLQHKSHLRRGIHHNPHLQRAWDKYGTGCFDFAIVREVPADHRYLEEEKQLALYSAGQLYNTSPVMAQGGTRIGQRNSPEHRARISAALKGHHPSSRKGGHHNWGHKSRETQVKHWPRIQATHYDGVLRVFESIGDAAMVAGVKRKAVSNILNGLSTQTRSGWSFQRVARG